MALVPYAHETVGTLTTAKGGTSATYNVQTKAGETRQPFDVTRRPEMAVITVETAAVRFTIDGTTPTATAGTAVGHIAYAGDVITLKGEQEIAKFLAINEVAGNGASLRLTYYRAS